MFILFGLRSTVLFWIRPPVGLNLNPPSPTPVACVSKCRRRCCLCPASSPPFIGWLLDLSVVVELIRLLRRVQGALLQDSVFLCTLWFLAAGCMFDCRVNFPCRGFDPDLQQVMHQHLQTFVSLYAATDKHLQNKMKHKESWESLQLKFLTTILNFQCFNSRNEGETWQKWQHQWGCFVAAVWRNWPASSELDSRWQQSSCWDLPHMLRLQDFEKVTVKSRTAKGPAERRPPHSVFYKTQSSLELI